VHQDGIGGRGHPVERCRFLPGPSEIRRCAGRGERQGFCRWRRLIETMFRAGKPVALVCHAPGALHHFKTPGGKPLVVGKTVTGFTNGEEEEVGLTVRRRSPMSQFCSRRNGSSASR
jgi:hypothetical protein